MKVVEALLSNFSVTQMILFAVIFCAAIKGIVEFGKWVYKQFKAHFDKEYDDKKQIEKICEELEKQEERIDKVEEGQESILRALETTNQNIELLIASDRDDIKSYITRQHHYFCYTRKWIDDYSLECIERRYSHYKKEGGNSFIEIFMEELRALPKVAPDDDHHPDEEPL